MPEGSFGDIDWEVGNEGLFLWVNGMQAHIGLDSLEELKMAIDSVLDDE